MEDKELEYFLRDYEPQDIGDLSNMLPNDDDELIEVFRQAKENEKVLNINDYKRINALKDYLKFETMELNNQKGGEINIEDFITLRTINKRYLHKFRYEGYLYEIGFKNLPENLQILHEITFKCFNKILEIAFRDAKKDDRVRIVIEHPTIPDQPISLPYMRFEDLNTQLIMTAIALVAQSHKELKLDHFMKVSTCRVNMPVGGTRSIDQYIAQKKGVLKINNTDNNCLLRAVIIAISYMKYSNEKDKDRKTELHNNYNSVRRYAGIQNPKIDRLKRAIKLNYDGPYGLDVAKQIENYLKIGINILGDVASFYKFLMKGNSEYAEQIYLFSNNNHFDVINSLPSFFSARQYCTKCEMAFLDNFEDHPCNEVCRVCKKKDCKKNAFIKCDWC